LLRKRIELPAGPVWEWIDTIEIDLYSFLGEELAQFVHHRGRKGNYAIIVFVHIVRSQNARFVDLRNDVLGVVAPQNLHHPHCLLGRSPGLVAHEITNQSGHNDRDRRRGDDTNHNE
jgi:hypothetical protein